MWGFLKVEFWWEGIWGCAKSAELLGGLKGVKNIVKCLSMFGEGGK
jgi:hypothetical protein